MYDAGRIFMTWKEFIKEESSKDYYKKLIDFVFEDSKINTIYPEYKDLFNAFDLCPIDKVKVVILAQDPYINKGEAHGLAFSVPDGKKIPPSLKNIYKELKTDLNIDSPNNGCLTRWAEQGVLLLNCILTVRAGNSGSHRGKGWEQFSDNAISKLNELDRPIVFMLWGAFAKSKLPLITNKNHLVLQAAHPSPYSASDGFFGCKHFSKANAFLIENKCEPIDWTNF
jgi:uracil-DNA glycosylase